MRVHTQRIYTMFCWYILQSHPSIESLKKKRRSNINLPNLTEAMVEKIYSLSCPPSPFFSGKAEGLYIVRDPPQTSTFVIFPCNKKVMNFRGVYSLLNLRAVSKKNLVFIIQGGPPDPVISRVTV